MERYTILLLGICTINFTWAQEIIELPHEKPTETVWKTSKKEYFSEIWVTQVVTNVPTPTMQVFRPKKPNSTAVIIAPGDGLYALSINSEGNDAAK